MQSDAADLRAEVCAGDARVAALEAELAALRQEHEGQRARYHSLLQASEAAVSSLSLPEVLEQVLRGIRALLGASAAAAWGIERGLLRRLAAVGLSERYILAATTLPLDEGVTGHAAREGRILAVADVSGDPRVKMRELWAQEGIRSFVSAPLVTSGKALGALNVYWRAVHHFSDEELGLLGGFANLAAAAIANARLHADTQRALAEVLRQKDMLDNLVRNAQDGIVVIDDQRRVVLFSPAAERLTGWKAADVLGRNCFAFLRCRRCEDLLCDAACPLVPLFEAGPDGLGSSYSELHIDAADGRRRWIGASWAVSRDAPGGKPAAILILRDITAAKEVDQMKSTIIAMVSHELRTPLTSIRALSELLVQHDFSADESRELLQSINRESERLAQLIANILDVARIEAGKMPYYPRAVSLRPHVEQAVKLLASHSDGHHFEVAIPDTLPWLWADPERLRQILDNLLSNAVKYSPSGGTIEVGARGGEREVEVWVSDEGLGIPQEQRDRVFERFHRLERSNVGGTGLGLHIARSLVELHGGRIWVEDRPRGGCTFRFSIPRAASALRLRTAVGELA
ncbi:MAG: GAF domain-containing protein [Chloroflexi bacterium]|nr:GAF domain-containing protein [Chloroflexota bacterium]MBI4507603.1 GAF domain-containing protein [Chloroflexota bacterium]